MFKHSHCVHLGVCFLPPFELSKQVFICVSYNQNLTQTWIWRNGIYVDAQYEWLKGQMCRKCATNTSKADNSIDSVLLKEELDEQPRESWKHHAKAFDKLEMLVSVDKVRCHGQRTYKGIEFPANCWLCFSVFIISPHRLRREMFLFRARQQCTA